MFANTWIQVVLRENLTHPKNQGSSVHGFGYIVQRTTIAKRVMKIDNDVMKQKAEYLSSCLFVGLIIDEGNNYRRSCPVYAATISCDREFHWRIMYVGQADCEGKKDGESIFKLVHKIFVDVGLEVVWEKILYSVGTDGASPMRSTSAFAGTYELLRIIFVFVFEMFISFCRARFAGLDCRGMLGKAFSAFFKREVKEDADFWHCTNHQLNLGLNDALEAIPALKLFYIPHLRMCYSEFKRSSTNRSELKDLLEELKEFDKSYDWKIFYPALFCLTRWLGFQLCAEILSRKSVRALLQKYAQRLRDKGLGPRNFDPYKYRQQRRKRGAGEDLDGDDVS